MKYPALTINKTKFKQNLEIIHKITNAAGVNVCAVTKGFCANPELVKIYEETGFNDFADSRLENLNRIHCKNARKWLLRLPMISEAKNVALFADISLNSEIQTVRALGSEAVKLGKKHGVVLMVELGDLREGVIAKDAVVLAGEILNVDGIKLLGIGVNFNCFGGIIPTSENLEELVRIAKDIEHAYSIRLEIISGGNSGSAYLLEDKKLPMNINNLRLGELILMGIETSFQKNIWSLHTDVFTLYTEIIELKEKPSMPYGKCGLDAFGEKPLHSDKGLMRRAIVACGRQDVSIDKIIPYDEQINIIGSSSDHIILDVTHADRDYLIGDIIQFKVSYGALLSLYTSEYVEKVLLNTSCSQVNTNI